MYNGILVLDKIYGATSRGCVNAVAKALGRRKQKMGHAGTLDSTASGALVLLVGNATRLSESIMNLPKTYVAELTFGWETDTDDAHGAPLSDPVRANYDEAALKMSLPAFQGVRFQTPPHISAVKVDGHRAHRLARAGRELEIQPRPVNITSLTYLGRTEDGAARLMIRCHRGTYIRSLARDLGRALGLGAHLTALRRLNVGPYTAADAISFNPQQPPSTEEVLSHILPISTLASQYYSYSANAFCEKRLTNGLSVYVSYLRPLAPGIVPISDGILVLGTEHLCLGKLEVQNGRSVITPQVNIPLEVHT